MIHVAPCTAAAPQLLVLHIMGERERLDDTGRMVDLTPYAKVVEVDGETSESRLNKRKTGSEPAVLEHLRKRHELQRKGALRHGEVG